jgi:hypothetical protein
MIEIDNRQMKMRAFDKTGCMFDETGYMFGKTVLS